MNVNQLFLNYRLVEVVGQALKLQRQLRQVREGGEDGLQLVQGQRVASEVQRQPGQLWQFEGLNVGGVVFIRTLQIDGDSVLQVTDDVEGVSFFDMSLERRQTSDHEVRWRIGWTLKAVNIQLNKRRKNFIDVESKLLKRKNNEKQFLRYGNNLNLIWEYKLWMKCWIEPFL